MHRSKLLDNIVQTRAGGRVERCHTISHIGAYNNAAHQWGCAMLLWALWPQDFPRLALACLVHDVPEFLIGDIPANALGSLPEVRGSLFILEEQINKSYGNMGLSHLAPEDYKKLKACDKLELYLWCREQLLFGNGFVADMMEELDRVFKLDPMPEPAQSLLEELRSSHVMPRQAGGIRKLVEG